MNPIPSHYQSILSLNHAIYKQEGHLIDWISRIQEARNTYESIHQLEEKCEKQVLLQKIEKVIKRIGKVVQKTFPRVSKDEFFRLANFHRNLQIYMKDKGLLKAENALEIEALLNQDFPEGCRISAAASEVLRDHLINLEFAS